MKLGGVEARLLHYGNAHTSGDTVVLFPNLKVIAIGDLFAPEPEPDYTAGGSLVGWGAALGEILKLDFDVAVASSGPGVTRAELEAFKKKMDTLVSRGIELVRKGVTEDRLMGQLKTDDLGWRLDFTGECTNSMGSYPGYSSSYISPEWCHLTRMTADGRTAKPRWDPGGNCLSPKID